VQKVNKPRGNKFDFIVHDLEFYHGIKNRHVPELNIGDGGGGSSIIGGSVSLS
jgi:hypothetical protein